MPRYVLQGFDISGSGIDKVNLVLRTPGGVTDTSYAYNFFGYVDYTFLNGDGPFREYDRLRYDGEAFDSGGDFTLLNTTWGAGRETVVFGINYFTSGFLAPVAGDTLPNFARDDGDILLEFAEILNETGGEKAIKKGPFKEGRDIPLEDLFNDDTSGPVIQGGSGNNQLAGGRKADLIVGAAGDDTANGKAGRDTLMLGTGDDTGYGGNGDDVISGYTGDDLMLGGTGADKLFGYDDNDNLKGQVGADKLKGGKGSDTLDGGKGDDVLIGNTGADRFVFSKGADSDKIKDFGRGPDRLLLNDNLWDGAKTAQDVVDDFATKGGGAITFDFGGGDELVLQGYTKLGTMADFIDII